MHNEVSGCAEFFLGNLRARHVKKHGKSANIFKKLPAFPYFFKKCMHNEYGAVQKTCLLSD